MCPGVNLDAHLRFRAQLAEFKAFCHEKSLALFAQSMTEPLPPLPSELITPEDMQKLSVEEIQTLIASDEAIINNKISKFNDLQQSAVYYGCLAGRFELGSHMINSDGLDEMTKSMELIRTRDGVLNKEEKSQIQQCTDKLDSLTEKHNNSFMCRLFNLLFNTEKQDKLTIVKHTHIPSHTGMTAPPDTNNSSSAPNKKL